MAKTPKNADGMVVFGDEELIKAFKKFDSKCDDKTKALLKAVSKQTLKHAKALTPKAKKSTVLPKNKKAGELRKSVKNRTKEKYLKGDDKSVQVKFGLAYGVPVNYGFNHPTAGRKRKSKLVGIRISSSGISSLRKNYYKGKSGRIKIQGVKMREETINNAKNILFNNAQKLLNDLERGF